MKQQTHHRLLIGLSAALLSTAATKAAPDSPEQTKAKIGAVIEAQQNAWNRGDIERFMEGYARSDTTVFVSGDHVTRGWQTVLERYKKKYPDREKMGTLTFSDLEITPLGSESAVVLGRWKLTRAQDQPNGRFTLIFRKLNDDWRIVHDHTSTAAP